MDWNSIVNLFQPRQWYALLAIVLILMIFGAMFIDAGNEPPKTLKKETK